MFCHKCGTKFDKDAKHCTHCSASLNYENNNSKTNESTATKADVIELLNKNSIQYCETSCYGCDRVCITFNHNTENQQCIESAITVLTVNKDVCKIYPHKILYISIEKRNTVLHMTDIQIQTPYPINFWKNVLCEKIFMQPHYSYIVNLNYVDNVTKNCVTLKYGDINHIIYASSRKIGLFKEALLKLKNIDISTD